MILRSDKFRRVTIVGVGLMGGSLGMALRKHGVAKEVVGLSQSQSSLVQAIKKKAIDIAETDIAKGIRNADLIVMATPVDSIIKLLDVINPHLKRGAIITDLGSAKTEIVEAANKILSAPNMFVGSHPLVGSEKKGVIHATAELFEGSQCVVTPTEQTNKGAVDRIKAMWDKLGCKVGEMSCEKHDQMLSYISHLPHILAFGLMESIPDEYIDFSPQSLKDTTRIAASSPQMWNDICMANSKNILKALDETITLYSKIRQTIVSGDRKTLMDHFTKAKEKREAIK